MFGLVYYVLMKLHKKISSWVADYGYMVQGAALSVFHHIPPKHYLDFVVEGKVPVILIPGILGKWGFMKRLGDKISLEGHPVYVVPELGINIFSIPSSAKMLRTFLVHAFSKKHIVPKVSPGALKIRAFIEARNIKGVVLVAHSKGGLIGKYLLAHYNDDQRVLGMVAVATPFSGSAMAKLVPHDAFRELKNDSEVIRDLEKHQEVNKKIISVIPEYDNHVWAERGSFLEGARENIEVPVHGHHRVIFSKKVQEIVLRSIALLSR